MKTIMTVTIERNFNASCSAICHNENITANSREIIDIIKRKIINFWCDDLKVKEVSEMVLAEDCYFWLGIKGEKSYQITIKNVK